MYTRFSVLNSEHQVYLVKTEDGKICIQKVIKTYNQEVYNFLLNNHIDGTPIIFDLYESDDELIVIEEFIEGDSLHDILNSSTKLSINQGINYIITLLRTIRSLHNIKPAIVHRDLKPSNIIINSKNEPILIDFNVAKHQNTGFNNKDTTQLGTIGYAAPEQYGFGVSTVKTDIYAIGIILKEVLDNTTLATTSQISDLNRIIAKCTELNPNDRYDTVTELETELINNIHSYSCESSLISRVKTSMNKYALPGFRNRKPWRMILATITYFLIAFLGSRIIVPGESNAIVILNRVIFTLIPFTLILCSFNYLDMHKHTFFGKSKNILLKIIGIILLDASVFATLIIMLVVLTNLLT